jgi:hypothetical protein
MIRDRVSLCLAGVLLLVAGGALWAQQDVGGLQKAYESRKISILPEDAPPGYLWWSATEGFKTIEEPVLLNLAGYDAEAQSSRAHHTLRSVANIGSWGTIIVGSLLFLDSALVPMILYRSLRINTTEMYVGAGAVALGGLVWTIFVLPIPPDTVPYGKITQIARDYNDTLIDTINKEQQSGGK